jgi:hypothetical protein
VLVKLDFAAQGREREERGKREGREREEKGKRE